MIRLVLLFSLIGVSKVLSDSFGHWFDDQHAEIYDTPATLSVQFYNGASSLPDSLTESGALIRLGPSVLNTQKANYSNYIDGFGRITKWSFGSGKDQILFQSSLLKSTLRDANDGKLLVIINYYSIHTLTAVI